MKKAAVQASETEYVTHDLGKLAVHRHSAGSTSNVPKATELYLKCANDAALPYPDKEWDMEFLYESGAKEVHMRSACPPIMYGCKFLNFSRSNSEMELLARKIIQNLEGDEGQKHIAEYADGRTERGQCMLKAICEEMGFDSLGYQSLDGLLEAIGLDRSKVCTYCWTGEE